jgi:hypothetical protein
MSPFSAGLKIWILTVVLNALYFGIASIMSGGYLNAFWSVPVLLVGCMAGLPLLFVFVELIKVMRRAPYSINARIAVLAFWVSVLIALFFVLLNLALTGQFYLQDELMQLLTGTTIAALLTAIFLCRGSLRKVGG